MRYDSAGTVDEIVRLGVFATGLAASAVSDNVLIAALATIQAIMLGYFTYAAIRARQADKKDD